VKSPTVAQESTYSPRHSRTRSKGSEIDELAASSMLLYDVVKMRCMKSIKVDTRDGVDGSKMLMNQSSICVNVKYPIYTSSNYILYPSWLVPIVRVV
jgi:hypothetical protein